MPSTASRRPRILLVRQECGVGGGPQRSFTEPDSTDSKGKFFGKLRLAQSSAPRGRVCADARERRLVKRQSANAIRTRVREGTRGGFYLSHRIYRNGSKGPSCRGLDTAAARRSIPTGERT